MDLEGRLVEVTGNIWNVEEIARISGSIAQLFLERFGECTLSEQINRATQFSNSVKDLNRGCLRSIILP